MQIAAIIAGALVAACASTARPAPEAPVEAQPAPCPDHPRDSGIHGVVRATDDGGPLAGVAVTVGRGHRGPVYFDYGVDIDWSGVDWFGGPGGEATTAADGTWTVCGLPPGDYHVTFTHAGNELRRSKIRVSPGVATTLNARLARVYAGPYPGPAISPPYRASANKPVTIQAPRRACLEPSIVGTVVDQGGNRVLLVTIVVTGPALEGQASEFTQGDGTYEICNLPDGTYTVLGIFGDAKVRAEKVVVKQGTPTTVDLRIETGTTRRF